MSAPSWITAAGRPSWRAPARRGGHWLAGRSAWACTFGVSGDEADRWFAESAALAPASAQWLCGVSSLAFRSRIAGERGRLEEQRMLAETATEFGREHGTEKLAGMVPLALGVSLAARGRPEEALALIERGVALARTFGQPIQLAYALLDQATVLRGLGEHQRAAGAIAEARSVLQSCPDPGILADRLAALDRPLADPPGPIRRSGADPAGTPGAQATARRSVRAGHRP